MASPVHSEVKPAPAPARADMTGPIEAILLTADRPLSAARIAAALAEGLGLGEPPGEPEVRAGVAALNAQYERTGRSFRAEAVAGGFRLMTLPGYAPFAAALGRQRSAARLSRAAVETLAVIAYRQPLTRAHLEAIRGVACGEVLKTLLERRLVAIKGRAEELGRPLLYGTTREFLDLFGLASIRDLPTAAELAPLEPPPPGAAAGSGAGPEMAEGPGPAPP